MSNSRRSFIRGAALTSVALSMPFKNELMAMASKSNPFGIQLWSVKQALAKDTLGVLKQIAANGLNVIGNTDSEGAGAGGAGGCVYLLTQNVSSNLNVNVSGGKNHEKTKTIKHSSLFD